MAYSDQDYLKAGQWIAENLNDPAAIEAQIRSLGLTKEDVLKAVQTQNAGFTMGNVTDWFSTKGRDPWAQTTTAVSTYPTGGAGQTFQFEDQGASPRVRSTGASGGANVLEDLANAGLTATSGVSSGGGAATDLESILHPTYTTGGGGWDDPTVTHVTQSWDPVIIGQQGWDGGDVKYFDPVLGGSGTAANIAKVLGFDAPATVTVGGGWDNQYIAPNYDIARWLQSQGYQIETSDYAKNEAGELGNYVYAKDSTGKIIPETAQFIKYEAPGFLDKALEAAAMIGFNAMTGGAGSFINAARAADAGDVIGALTAVAGAAGISPDITGALGADTVANISTAAKVMNVVNAIDKGDWLSAISAGAQLGNIESIGGFTGDDFKAASNIYNGIQNGDVGMLVSGANQFINSPELAIAGPAATVVQALAEGNYNRAIQAGMQLNTALQTYTTQQTIKEAYADPSRAQDVLPDEIKTLTDAGLAEVPAALPGLDTVEGAAALPDLASTPRVPGTIPKPATTPATSTTPAYTPTQLSQAKNYLGGLLKNPDFNPADLTAAEMSKFVDAYATATPTQRQALLQGTDRATFAVIDQMLGKPAGALVDQPVPAGTPELKAYEPSLLDTAKQIGKAGVVSGGASLVSTAVQGMELVNRALGGDTEAFQTLQNDLKAYGDKELSKLQGNEKAVANGISSMTISLPFALIGGAAAAVPAVVATVANGTWMESKEAGLSDAQAAARTIAMSSIEAAGELIGVKNMNAILKGVPISSGMDGLFNAAKEYAKMLGKENFTELLTTVGQFAADKIPEFGLGQNATVQDLGQALKDTVIATTTAVLGSSAVSSAMRAGNAALDSATRVSDAEVDPFGREPPKMTKGTRYEDVDLGEGLEKQGMLTRPEITPAGLELTDLDYGSAANLPYINVIEQSPSAYLGQEVLDALEGPAGTTALEGPSDLTRLLGTEAANDVDTGRALLPGPSSTATEQAVDIGADTGVTPDIVQALRDAGLYTDETTEATEADIRNIFNHISSQTSGQTSTAGQAQTQTVEQPSTQQTTFAEKPKIDLSGIDLSGVETANLPAVVTPTAQTTTEQTTQPTTQTATETTIQQNVAAQTALNTAIQTLPQTVTKTEVENIVSTIQDGAVKTAVETALQTLPDVITKTQLATVVNSATETLTNPAAQLETKTQTTLQTAVQTMPEVITKTEVETLVKSLPQTETKLQLETALQTIPQTITKTELQTIISTITQTVTKTETPTVTQTETPVVAKTGTPTTTITETPVTTITGTPTTTTTSTPTTPTTPTTKPTTSTPTTQPTTPAKPTKTTKKVTATPFALPQVQQAAMSTAMPQLANVFYFSTLTPGERQAAASVTDFQGQQAKLAKALGSKSVADEEESDENVEEVPQSEQLRRIFAFINGQDDFSDIDELMQYVLRG